MLLTLPSLQSCFARPVAETYPNIGPQYLRKIKNPIALSDMERKIKKKKYAGADALAVFRKDVDTMVSNCKCYNTPESIFYVFANNLAKKFESLMSRYAVAPASKKPG